MESKASFVELDVLSEFLNDIPSSTSDRSARDALLSHCLNTPTISDPATKLKRLSKTLHLDRLFWQHSLPPIPTAVDAREPSSTMDYSEHLIRNYLQRTASRSSSAWDPVSSTSGASCSDTCSQSTVRLNNPAVNNASANEDGEHDQSDLSLRPEGDGGDAKSPDLFDTSFAESHRCQSDFVDYARDCFSAPNVNHLHTVKMAGHCEPKLHRLHSFNCPSPDIPYNSESNRSSSYPLRRGIRFNASPHSNWNRPIWNEPRRRRPPSGAASFRTSMNYNQYDNPPQHRSSPFSQYYRRTKSASPQVPLPPNCLPSSNINACNEFGCYKRLDRCTCGFSPVPEPNMNACCSRNMCELCFADLPLEVYYHLVYCKCSVPLQIQFVSVFKATITFDFYISN